MVHFSADGVTFAPAQVTAPAPGSTLSGSTVTFTWSTGKGVTKFFIYGGNAQGANDIIGQDEGTSTSATIAGIPTDGRTIYVRIWSLINGAWQYSDSTYTTKR